MDTAGKITDEQVEAWKRANVEPWAHDRIPKEVCVGRMLSQALYDSSYAVLRAVYAALEDQNYHDLAAYIMAQYPDAFSTPTAGVR